MNVATPESLLRASIVCSVVLRLDGADPLDAPPDSEADYRREYEPVWAHFLDCLEHIGATPLKGPPPGWWNVTAFFTFHPEHMPRVMALLSESQVPTEVCDAS